MDNTELKTLQKKVLKTKKDLKEWETIFAKKHGRPPTVKDIAYRPNIEKFYKKYNQLKKDLKQAEQQQISSQLSASSPPRVFNNDTQGSSQQQRLSTRRDSVEFVRSPSYSMSRKRPSIFEPSASSSSQQSVRRLSEFEEMKSALASAASSSQVSSTIGGSQRQLTEDEAFWLDVSSTPTTESVKNPFTASSQPIPTSTAFKFSNSQQQTSNTQQLPPRQLILGGGSSQQPPPKRRLKQLKLFGQNPFQRASQDELSPLASSPSPRPAPISSQQSSSTQSIHPQKEQDDDEEMEEIIIVNHEINPFKNYDPSYWQDPSFSVGPGFFASAKCIIPMLNDPTRRSRVLYKLEKGTLGEVLEENKRMEEEVSEELRQFIDANSQLDTLEAALTTIDDNLLNQPEYTYKKRPLQKRQTRLYKMKFVDHRPQK